jgi:cyclic beta-1,2-glucan synthetase
VSRDVFVKRFHADPRVQATELILQERVPREAILAEARPADAANLRIVAPPASARRFVSAHTANVHKHFLSNGRYTMAITQTGGGFSTWRGLAITRRRDDRTTDAGSHFIYLRDPWSGDVWSPTYLPFPGREPDDYAVSFDLDKCIFTRRDGDFETQLQIAVSPEDDLEVRRLSITNHGTRPREIEVTSYAEIVLGKHDDDIAHPAFGKLFVETAVRRAERRPAVQPAAARGGRGAPVGVSRPGRRWTPGRRGRMGNRPRAVHRPRPYDGQSDRARRPRPVRHNRRRP